MYSEITLPCGCVEGCSTLDIIVHKFIVKYCDKHKKKIIYISLKS